VTVSSREFQLLTSIPESIHYSQSSRARMRREKKTNNRDRPQTVSLSFLIYSYSNSTNLKTLSVILCPCSCRSSINDNDYFRDALYSQRISSRDGNSGTAHSERSLIELHHCSLLLSHHHCTTIRSNRRPASQLRYGMDNSSLTS